MSPPHTHNINSKKGMRTYLRTHGTIAEIINLAKLTLTTPLRGDFGGMVAREDVPPSTMQKLANKLELLLIDLYESDTARSSFGPHAIHDGRFLALVKYLREHIGEPVTLEEISRDLSMSVTAIQRLCRKECGCGPIDLLISLRIGEAKRLIAKWPSKDQTLETIGIVK